MLLIGVKEDKGWLYSRWNLTWGAGWKNICKAGWRLLADFDNPEVYVDGEKVGPFADQDDILELPERGQMMVRGLSKTLGIPVMVSLVNQTKLVDVTLPATKEVVDSTDYETFNKEIAPYVDSLELVMF
ncbi:MAG: hypothetical protein IKX62_03535 [Bacteroidales bacterium]|nr:hypothetical protein [Bacteroidales bacterium]